MRCGSYRSLLGQGGKAPPQSPRKPRSQPGTLRDRVEPYEARSPYPSLRRSRRTAEGKSKREIIRCLKRYIAREVYRVLAVTQLELVPAEEDLVSPAQVLENGSKPSRLPC